VGTDALPSSTRGLPARLVLGPALRAQSDGRLVRLVRDGYESAFEEIVRRYRRPLDRFAASMVGGHSEDVTQDSFRKALVALRRDEDEIELRPWLYRIVRNTALNDLRDRPPAAAELAEDLMAGGRSAAAVAEERAEVESLTATLRALPENQRAALVMRELEGMSHEEIAAALGISGGAARQAIARGRATVRGGLGAIVPLPLLRALASGGDPGTDAALGAGAAAASGAGALKVGLATVVVAGGIGAGVAIDHHGADHHRSKRPQAVTPAPTRARARASAERIAPTPSPVLAEVDDKRASGGPHKDASGGGHDDGHRRHRHDQIESQIEPVIAARTVVDDHPPGPGAISSGPEASPKNAGGGGPGPSQPSSGHGSGGHGDDRSGPGGGSGDGAGSGGGGGSGSGSGRSGSSSGGRGSDDLAEAVAEAPPVETVSSEASSSGGPGPSPSGGEGSGSSGGPSPTLDDPGSGGDSGSHGGPGPGDDSEISP
jgi:RNA polymerase sigma factor (sigma-70 family)